MTDTQQNNDATETTPVEAQEAPSEDVNEQSGTDTPNDSESASEDVTEPPEDTPPEDDEDAQDDGDHAELPAWALKQLQKARKDAANYRTKFAEANERLSKAVSPEDFEAARNDLATAKLELDTERIANRYGLPDEMRQVLAGKTTEEVEAHAKILSKFVPAQGVNVDDLSGGLNPGTDEGTLDPRALAAKHRRR